MTTMAKLLRRKRKGRLSVEVSESLPFFEVLYMGRIETEPKRDRDCTRVIVQHLVDKTRNEPLKPVRITITTRGIWVQEGPNFNPPRRETFVPIHNISYGSADKKYTKVFTFVTNFRDPIEPNTSVGSAVPLYCYAFRCESQAIARAMVVYLLRAFKEAYLSWQREASKKDVQKRLFEGPRRRSDDRRRSYDTWRPIIGRRLPGDGRRQSDSTSESIGSNSDRQALDSSGSTDEENEETGVEYNSKTDRLSHYLERWVRQQRAPSQSNQSTDTLGSEESDLSIAERDERFRTRADRFSRPDLLNCEVDWFQEMRDPDVQNVLQGVMKMNIPP